MNDSINRQKAIEAIETHAEKIYQNVKKGATYPKKEWFSGMAYACEIIGALPSAEPQWIPVSERLPKETGIYLVTLKTDGVPYFEDEFPNGFVYASAYEAVTMHWGYGDKNVIAWMPLAKPYHETDHDSD